MQLAICSKTRKKVGSKQSFLQNFRIRHSGEGRNDGVLQVPRQFLFFYVLLPTAY